ncbi:hypothetical protein MML48_4g00006404 [Holotrichia oblita]|uniref:Uncharacterized protein n=1 Tax=Holotrichia oblita TaxID=644536 RepID=A0ACB9T971_HOLOL|nr:hypothetical protein MML48_4g00006404 [Holotrichia oblita]
MVPHPHSHPPPPLPYFPPFHLPHHPTEYPSSVELTPLSTYSEQSPQPTTTQFPPQDDQPKVVVPNIEEELNYLAQDNVVYKSNANSCNANSATCVRPNTVVVNKKSESPTGPGVGFMNSYLKFLQGEKDNSPPPASRGNRKQSWTKTKTVVTTTVPDVKPTNTNTNTNGVVTRPPPIPAPISTPRLSQGDPQDDPRYFPLPKERKKNSFDSSDDGVSSDDEFFHHKKTSLPPVKVEHPPPVHPPKEKEKQKRKGRPPKVGDTTEKKKPKAEKQNKHSNQEGTKPARKEVPAEVIPKRESSKRAAKERSNIKLIAKREEEGDENDFVDSDSDPAWTPQYKDEPEQDVMMTKKTRRGKPGRKRNSRNLLSTAAEGTGIHDISDNSNDVLSTKKQRASVKKENQKQLSDQSNESNTGHSLTQKNLPTMSDDNFFKPGEFVVIKSELSEEWPAIWRVDGKTLLQKYEPFEQNGQTLYRNISTYTSWTPESKKQYMSVPVKYRSQSHLETIVEFLRNEMTIVDHAFLDKVMKENEVYQDNFEVYIQTLISQALDSNFLTEIFQEQDDYFLSNVQTIDEITRSKKQKLLTLLRWPHPVQIAVSTWPCFNIIRELSTPDFQNRNCAACQQSGVSVRVLMYGQPYNSTTLEGCQPDPQAANEKVSNDY